MSTVDGTTRAMRSRVSREILRGIAGGLPLRDAAASAAWDALQAGWESGWSAEQREALLDYVAEVAGDRYIAAHVARLAGQR